MAFHSANPRRKNKKASIFFKVTKNDIVTFTNFLLWWNKSEGKNSATVEWNNVFQLPRSGEKKEENSIFHSTNPSTYFYTKVKGNKTQIVIVSLLFMPHRSTPSASFNQHIFKRGSNLAEQTKQNDAENWWRQLISVSIKFFSEKWNGASWWCLFIHRIYKYAVEHFKP